MSTQLEDQKDPLTLIHGDALSSLRTLEDESVQCCVTSPPYWGLRDYGHESQIGLENTPEEYVARLVEIFREVRRVLRRDGTLWLNLGDSYSASGKGPTGWNGIGDQERRQGFTTCKPKDRSVSRWGGGGNSASGCKPKDLVGIPWMVAFALRADGWYLRSDIIWAKSNPMPESVTDRPTKAHEYIFLLSRNERYYYDADAIKEPPSGTSHGGGRENAVRKSRAVHGETSHKGLVVAEPAGQDGRNRRSVWNVATSPFADAHFATFPPDLIKPCILAGTSAHGACSACGAPWRRNVERSANYGRREPAHAPRSAPSKVDSSEWKPATVTDRGWSAACECDAKATPCAVIDCFAGSGTTGKVAIELGRKAILIEPKAEYVEMIKRRCQTTIGLPLEI